MEPLIPIIKISLYCLVLFFFPINVVCVSKGRRRKKLVPRVYMQSSKDFFFISLSLCSSSTPNPNLNNIKQQQQFLSICFLGFGWFAKLTNKPSTQKKKKVFTINFY